MRIAEYRTMFDEKRLPVLEEVKGYNIQITKDMNCKERVAEVLEAIGLNRCTEERCYCFVLTQRMRIEALFCIGQGCVDCATIDIKGMFQKVLMFSGKNIIIAHNHPSGSLEISKEDYRLTDTIKSGCKILGLNFIDSLIIGETKYDIRSIV